MDSAIIILHIPYDGTKNEQFKLLFDHLGYKRKLTHLFLAFCLTKHTEYPMKHIVKIMSLLVALSAVWISLLQTSVLPKSYTWLLPLYFIVSLGCYGLLMVGIGLMHFPTCPHEAILLQQDVVEAKEFLKGRGVDVGTD